MANRFLETNYYKSPFVRSLKGAIKGLYSFIICDCTPSGIWAKDIEAASLYIGFTVNDEDFFENFVERGKAIDLGNGKYFFPDFIEHQYPSGLHDDNKAHKNIILELNKLGFLRKTTMKKDVKNSSEKRDVDVFFSKKVAPSKPLESPPKGTQGNGYGNGQGQGIGNGKGIGQGNTEPEVEKKTDEKFIVPQMCQIWYASFTGYTQDKQNDFEGMGKILQFMSKQAKLTNIEDCDNQVKILNTLQLIADQVNRTPFWINKPIKSIANNIQEFYNNIKNPINGNGKGNHTATKNGFSREGVQAELNERLKSRQQS